MKRTTRASVQPKPTPAPPTLQPHTDGRWQVVDYKGYVLYCGPRGHAEAIERAHWAHVKAPGQSVSQAIGRA